MIKALKYNIKAFLIKAIKIEWMAFKVLVFISLLFFALVIKVLRHILDNLVKSIDYLTTLGKDGIDGKIIRLLENTKQAGRNLYDSFGN